MINLTDVSQAATHNYKTKNQSTTAQADNNFKFMVEYQVTKQYQPSAAYVRNARATDVKELFIEEIYRLVRPNIEENSRLEDMAADADEQITDDIGELREKFDSS